MLRTLTSSGILLIARSAHRSTSAGASGPWPDQMRHLRFHDAEPALQAPMLALRVHERLRRPVSLSQMAWLE